MSPEATRRYTAATERSWNTENDSEDGGLRRVTESVKSAENDVTEYESQLKSSRSPASDSRPTQDAMGLDSV